MEQKQICGINCQFRHKLFDNGSMIIARYSSENPVTLPNGDKTSNFTVKGIMLPEVKDLEVLLNGYWEKYYNKNTDSTSYTFNVTSFTEIQPSERKSIIAYLQTLQGVGKKTAEKLYEKFDKQVFEFIEKDPSKLSLVKGISPKKAEKISTSYGKRKYAKELFQYLFPYHIKDTRVMKAYKRWGDDALSLIKDNPYILTDIPGIGFETAEQIARHENIPLDFEPRIEAGILEVLIQGEKGGNLFSKRIAFPRFVYNSFLRESVFKLMMDEDECNITGGTYLPRDVAYLMSLKLLSIPLSESKFNQIAIKLHQSKKIFISVDRNGDEEEVRFYRYHTAKAEYSSAKKLAALLDSKPQKIDKLDTKVYDAEKKLQIRLSDEQVNAVKMALSNPFSIITGGPGTGKTSVQKGILNVFTALYPNAEVLLAAPTGRAAKRMNESTGFPVSTLHKALMLYAGEDGEAIETSGDFTFDAKLIIVDECSMLGSLLFSTLLDHIRAGTRVVMVGDVDQLPSIEVGAVLRELIDSGVVPVTRLTKTFRQAAGSSIAINASRIKKGVHELQYGDDYTFIEADNSKDIADKILDIYPSLVDEHGIDNVVCLSAYRKSTESGTNNLNHVLREKIRTDIDDTTPFYERKGVKYYLGDKVMFTKNTEDLTNGDIGEIIEIQKGKDYLGVTCIFDSIIITLEDEDINFLELALAMTVHKSQGSEYPIVIMTCDNAHKRMLKRNLVYTGITRAKKNIIIIGQIEAFNYAIDVIDSNYRRSKLGALINYYININNAGKPPKETDNQIKFDI